MKPTWRVRYSTDVLAYISAILDPLDLLSQSERNRHDRLVYALDRDDFVAARALTRLVLLERDARPVSAGALMGLGFEQRCPTCSRPHGQPVLSGQPAVHISWAHAKGVVAAAVADRPVGVDVERVGDRPPPNIPGSGIDPWLVWTRAEAITKLGLVDLEGALSWADQLRFSPGEHLVTLPVGEVWFVDRVWQERALVATMASARGDCPTEDGVWP